MINEVHMMGFCFQLVPITCISKSGGDVVVLVQVDGRLEVVVLAEAGASAVLGPLVLPEAGAICRGAG